MKVCDVQSPVTRLLNIIHHIIIIWTASIFTCNVCYSKHIIISVTNRSINRCFLQVLCPTLNHFKDNKDIIKHNSMFKFD